MHKAPLSMESSRQKYGVGSYSLLWGNLSDPEIETRSLALQENSLPSEPPEKPKTYTVNYEFSIFSDILWSISLQAFCFKSQTIVNNRHILFIYTNISSHTNCISHSFLQVPFHETMSVS